MAVISAQDPECGGTHVRLQLAVLRFFLRTSHFVVTEVLRLDREKTDLSPEMH